MRSAVRKLELSDKSQNQSPADLRGNLKCHRWGKPEEHYQVPKPWANHWRQKGMEWGFQNMVEDKSRMESLWKGELCHSFTPARYVPFTIS